MTRPLRGGGERVRARLLRKKNHFLSSNINSPKNVDIKLEGVGGDKALVARPLKKTFFAASLRTYNFKRISKVP